MTLARAQVHVSIEPFHSPLTADAADEEALGDLLAFAGVKYHPSRIESIGFSLGLWTLSRILAPMLLQAGIELSVPTEVEPEVASPTLAAAEPAMRQVVTYLGAGIYEETVFRLMLFTAIILILRAMEFSGLLAILFAAMASAVVFSLAHHVGPYGQEYSNYLFLFRVVAGLYFAILFQMRGFGIAVGTHACYNVMVSIA